MSNVIRDQNYVTTLSAISTTSATTVVPLKAEQSTGKLLTLSSIGSHGDSSAIDSFGRLRVSEAETVLDFKQVADNLPLQFDDQETSGGGTSSTYNTNKASSTLAVSSLTAGTRVRQSKVWGQYQPGKSQLILLTGVFKTGGIGITKRIGYFNAKWGLFFEQDDGDMYVVQRTYNTGSAVDTRVVQSSWNVDKMDGTGVSGLTLDFTKTQIMIIDFEWLGVGRVRMGFVVNGIIYYSHNFSNANNLAEVYLSNPDAPIRYEISNDGTGGASSLDCICSSIQSECGTDPTDFTTYVSRDGTPITLANQDLFCPVISIRLKSTHPHVKIRILDVSILITTNTNYEWALFLNPTKAGADAASWVNVTNSSIQYDISRTNANTLTDGYKIDGGYGSSTAQFKGIATSNTYSYLTIGTNIAGTSDELVLGIKNIDGNGGTCYAGIMISEYA